ncbi:MAG TPA: porin [bacterium]|nr:porin [bacterium]
MNRIRIEPKALALLLGIVLVAFASSLFAQEEASPGEAAPDESPEDPDDLDQRVRILERKLEIREEGDAEKSKSAASVSAGKDGFSWKSADGAYQLKIRGYLHADGRFFSEDEQVPATTTFLMRRVRAVVEATVAKSFDIRIMPDWGGGVASIQDAYVDYRMISALRLRAGKMKAPFGLERLQSATEIVFVERAHPTSLSPNRDIGLQALADLKGGAFTAAAGIFNGVVDGGSSDGDINDGKEAVGRIFVTPFKSSMSRALSGFSLGIAGSTGENKGTASSTGLASLRSPGQLVIFSYRSGPAGTVIAQGKHQRFSPQAQWYFDRFGAHAEYTESTQEIQLGADRIDHLSRAYEVTLQALLTHDQQTARGVNPKRPFDPGAGQWGAVEIDARISMLAIEGDAFPVFADPATSVNEAKSYAGGLQWILNRNVKLVTDYEETHYQGGAAGGGDRETEKIIFSRVQYSF